MPGIRPLYTDPFAPVLLNSTPLVPSVEQVNLINYVLDRACSDSKFAEKAKAAIYYILTAKKATSPVITTINPNQATLGAAAFTLHVIGTGFDASSKIFWNGSEEPTTVVSPTELTTGVDMSTAIVAMDIPVQVQGSNGVPSNAMTFSLKAPVVLAASAPSKPPVKPVVPITPLPSVADKKEP